VFYTEEPKEWSLYKSKLINKKFYIDKFMYKNIEYDIYPVGITDYYSDN
jgi:hypothetical protein